MNSCSIGLLVPLQTGFVGMIDSEVDDATLRARERLGTVLRGKYRLDSVIGIGGMAVVYKSTHRNEAEFAVKLLDPELSRRPNIRARFLREGKAANSIKHPGVVAVVDDDVAEDGTAFLVMELLRGASVESLWDAGDHLIPLRAALSIASQLLDVLAATHEKGIVHRDIKPANLFATLDGTLKVLDFGIARVRDMATADPAGGPATRTGFLLGTPAFMAPEQALAKSSEIDATTDLWSVGATLFRLLAGQTVHAGENPAQLMVNAATTRARSLSSVASEVPRAVAAVIDRALCFDKADRWANAASMRAAIEQASRDTFGEPTSKTELAGLVEAEMVRAREQEISVAVFAASGAGAAGEVPSPKAPRREFTDVEHMTTMPVSARAVLALQDAPTGTVAKQQRPAVTRTRRRHPLVWMGVGGAVVAASGVILSRLPTVHAGRRSDGTVTTSANDHGVANDAAWLSSTPRFEPTPERRAPPAADSAIVTSGPTPITTASPSNNPSPLTSNGKPAGAAALAGRLRPPRAPLSASASPPSRTPTCTVVENYDNEGQPHFKKVCE